MPKIKAFENYSDEYDIWFDDHSDAYASELETIRQLMPAAGAEGLEVGVGSGKFAAPLGIKTGIEPSEKMADKARARGIKVYSGTAENLPFHDSCFDFVLMVTTICFVDDIVQSFKEALRVLKEGGLIIVGFVDKESEIGQQYSEKKESSKFYSEATFFSTTEVLKLLEESGFTVTKVLQTLIPGKISGTITEGFGAGAFVAIKGVGVK